MIILQKIILYATNTFLMFIVFCSFSTIETIEFSTTSLTQQCIDSKPNNLFKQEVVKSLIQRTEFQICDSILFIEKLLNVFQNDNNMCNFAFIAKPFDGLKTHGVHYDGSRLRRADFGIIAYIHFKILKKGALNINKDFSINHKSKKIEFGIYVGSPKYKGDSKNERTSNMFLKKLYRKMLQWIKFVNKNKISIGNAAGLASYPFNNDYKWVN